MEDGWGSHVSPLMMGVGIAEMHHHQALGEMHQTHTGQDIGLHQDHPQEMNRDLGHEIQDSIENDMGQEMSSQHQEAMGGGQDYYSHQVRAK